MWFYVTKVCHTVTIQNITCLAHSVDFNMAVGWFSPLLHFMGETKSHENPPPFNGRLEVVAEAQDTAPGLARMLQKRDGNAKSLFPP